MTTNRSTSATAHDELHQLARQLGALRRGRRILAALAAVFAVYLGWVFVESARPPHGAPLSAADVPTAGAVAVPTLVTTTAATATNATATKSTPPAAKPAAATTTSETNR